MEAGLLQSGPKITWPKSRRASSCVSVDATGRAGSCAPSPWPWSDGRARDPVPPGRRPSRSRSRRRRPRGPRPRVSKREEDHRRLLAEAIAKVGN